MGMCVTTYPVGIPTYVKLSTWSIKPHGLPFQTEAEIEGGSVGGVVETVKRFRKVG